MQFAWAFYEMFGAFEFMYHQFQAHALPAEVWERWSATLSWWISMPGVQAWWRAKPAPFNSTFSAFVETRNQHHSSGRRRCPTVAGSPTNGGPKASSDSFAE